MNNLTDWQKQDYRRFFVEKGEPGFSPEKNKQTVENSIKKYDAMRKKKMQQHVDGVRERASAIASWLKSMMHSNSPADKYFGRKWMAYLRGETIIDRIKDELVTYDQRGHIIRRPI